MNRCTPSRQATLVLSTLAWLGFQSQIMPSGSVTDRLQTDVLVTSKPALHRGKQRAAGGSLLHVAWVPAFLGVLLFCNVCLVVIRGAGGIIPEVQP